MLTISLIGYPNLAVDDEALEISRRKALALFVYLVATNRPHTRDHLCTLLWSEFDARTARAELRRMLSALNQTPLGDYIQANRQTVRLSNPDAMQVDVWQLDRHLNEGNWSALAEQIGYWTTPFLHEFSTGDAPQFDEWQQLMTIQFQQRLIPVIERLVIETQSQGDINDSIRLLHAWLTLDPDNEGLHRWVMRAYVQADQATAALEHYDRLVARLLAELEAEPQPETFVLAEQIRSGQPIDVHIFAGGMLPPLPQMLIGRESALNSLKQQLGVGHDETDRRLLVVHGWPGIGKTTLTAALAHDLLVQRHFRDGILWISLGQSPDVFNALVKWGKALRLPDIHRVQSISEVSMMLTNAILDRQLLMIVDDVWDEAHVSPFKIGGRQSVMLVTTRLNRVAQALVTRRDELYRLPVLEDDRALELLRTLAPEAVESYPDEIRALVQDLEGLPLALQVAGRLLREEHALGWGAKELLEDLREGTRLLDARAPADRQQADDDVPTTIAALLNLSTDNLTAENRKRFAMLGVFAPKPAVFELEALQAVWDVDDARPTVRRLVERGLLEVVPGGQFQMHALLVQHARAMFGGEHAVPTG